MRDNERKEKRGTEKRKRVKERRSSLIQVIVTINPITPNHEEFFIESKINNVIFNLTSFMK